jgi:hypothetical protein
MAGEMDIQTPSDVLNKLSQALIEVSRGDPMVALRNELSSKFNAIESRFETYDKAVSLQHEDQVRVPTQIDKAIQGLRDALDQGQKTSAAELRGDLRTAIAELAGALEKHVAETSEKFTGVYNQFSQNDKALTAALQAQEKQAIATDSNNRMASTKMEDGFTKLIDAVVKTLETKTGNLESSINEVKLQMNSMQSRIGATSEVRQDNRGGTLVGIAIASVIVAIVAAAAAVAAVLMHH